MTKISAVIITQNEELNIERCIRSMRSIADEIVVVDAHSTDKTEEICQKLCVKFVKHDFVGFGQQKQYAVSLSTYDWVISLDADEELSDELIQSIQELKQVLDDHPQIAYAFRRKNFYCDKQINHASWKNDYKIRLFNKRYANWTDNLVHETIDKTNLVEIKILEGYLHHFTYQSVTQHKQKTTNYARLGAMEVKASGKSYALPTILAKAGFRFIKDYIFKLGFLDGYYGFKISQMNARYVYLKYSGGKK